MTLDEEIKQLKLKRLQVARSASFLFSRAKRDVRLAVSPTRLIKRNRWKLITAAFLGGVVLAPTTGRRDPSPRPEPTKPRSNTAWLRILAQARSQLKQVIPSSWNAFIPDLGDDKPRTPPAEASTPHSSTSGKAETDRSETGRGVMGSVLESLSRAALKMDWMSLAGQFLAGYTMAQTRRQPPAPTPVEETPVQETPASVSP